MYSLIHFIGRPSGTFDRYIENREKIKLFVQAFLFLFLARIILGMIVYVEKILEFPGVSYILKSHKSFNPAFDHLSLALLLIIIAPVFEELSFRGFFSENKLVIRVSVGAFIVMAMNIVYEASPFRNLFNTTTLIAISFALFIAIVNLLSFYADSIHKFISDRWTMLMYLSMLLFSVLHLQNFNLGDLSGVQLAFVPLALLPYLSLAVALSFVRVRCGLGWAIVFHAVNNAIVVLISLV